MSAGTYRKLPVEVEAIQFTGRNLNEVEEFVGTALIFGRILPCIRLVADRKGRGEVHQDPKAVAELWVKANQKWLPIELDEWIIKDELGCYPCKPAQFDMTYIQVEEAPEPTFKKELESLINKYSLENGSNTPDFILASYLNACLESFDAATRERSQWTGGGEPRW